MLPNLVVPRKPGRRHPKKVLQMPINWTGGHKLFNKISIKNPFESIERMRRRPQKKPAAGLRNTFEEASAAQDDSVDCDEC